MWLDNLSRKYDSQLSRSDAGKVEIQFCDYMHGRCLRSASKQLEPHLLLTNAAETGWLLNHASAMLQTSDEPPRMYSWPQLGEPNLLSHSPLLFTKATCGLDPDTRVITLPNDTVVDIVMNNLVDEVHPQHLHG